MNGDDSVLTALKSFKSLVFISLGLMSLGFAPLSMASATSAEVSAQVSEQAEQVSNETDKAPIDYETLVKRYNSDMNEQAQIYSTMLDYRNIVRVMNIYDVALEVSSMPYQQFSDFMDKADFSYQKDTKERNPAQVFFYSYESYWMVHHHEDTAEQLISNALDFYYGRNGTKQDVQAAQFMLKTLRSYNKVELNKALDALLASKKLAIEF